LINDVGESLNETKLNLTQQLHDLFSPILERVKISAHEATYLHHINNLCDEGGFKIAKVTHFQKQNFFNTSVATDGSFIYIYVSSCNGGMYKIGTGEAGTIPGKIYLFSPVSRVEEVCWVYCKGKLYLRNNAREVTLLKMNSYH
jgi:other hect domain ubiquitin protein ligase E3